jgi:hypothetical protein
MPTDPQINSFLHSRLEVWPGFAYGFAYGFARSDAAGSAAFSGVAIRRGAITT